MRSVSTISDRHDGQGLNDDGVSKISTAKGREAYAVLRDGIHDGVHPPGARLKEVELATRLGMSRTPIREAFRQLERDGVVTIVPNRGAVVRELSAEEIDDVYALRAVLEGFCASRAATRMGAQAISHLEEVNDELERRTIGGDESSDALIRLNSAFHQAIVAGSANSRVNEVLAKAAEVPFNLKRAFWESTPAREAAVVYHREIVEAIRSRDSMRAEAVMRSHIYSVKDYMTEQQRATGIQSLLDDPS